MKHMFCTVGWHEADVIHYLGKERLCDWHERERLENMGLLRGRNYKKQKKNI